MSAREDVERLLALLPMSDDGTGHVADCGWTEEAPTCGCYSLPGLLAQIRVDERQRVLADVEARIATATPKLPDDPRPDEAAYAVGMRDARRIVRRTRDDLEARP